MTVGLRRLEGKVRLSPLFGFYSGFFSSLGAGFGTGWGAGFASGFGAAGLGASLTWLMLAVLIELTIKKEIGEGAGRL